MSQGKTDIPGVDDGEDMLVTDVSMFLDSKIAMNIKYLNVFIRKNAFTIVIN